MKLLRLNFLYLAVVLTSFFNVSHAQITTHEELINAAINKDENNRLIPAKVPLEHIGVIGYDGSYSLEKTKRDYYPVLWIPNSTDFVSKYPDENTLSLVAISDGDVSPAKRMGLVFSLREPGKEAVITPNLYVYTNSSDLIDTGIFVVHDSPESKKRATFENDVTVDMSQQALEGKVEGISFWGVQGIFKKNVYSHAYAGIKTGGSDLVIAGNVFINAERGIHFVGRNSLTANKIHIEASDVAFYSDPIDQSGFQINGKQIDMISPLLRQGFYESDELTINNKGGALLNIYSNFDAKNKVYAPMVVSNSSGRVNITVDNDQSKVLLYFKNMAGGVRGSLSIKNGATVETAFNCRECLSSDLSIRVSQGGRLNIHPISHWEKVDDVGFPQKNESTIPRLDITGGIVEISSPALNYYYISNLSGSHGVLILPFDVPGKELKLSPEEDAETYLWHTPPVHFNLVSQEGDLRVKLNFLNFNKALVEGREFPLFGLVRKSRLKSPYQPPFENSYRNVNARWVQQAMSYLRPVRTEGTLYNYSYSFKTALNARALKEARQDNYFSRARKVADPKEIGLFDENMVIYVLVSDITQLKPEIEPTDLVDTLVGLESANLLTLQGFNDTLYDRLGELRLNTRDRYRGLWVRTKLNNAKKSGLFGFDAHSELVDVGFDKTWSWAHGSATAGLTYQWQNLHLKNPHTSLNNHVSSVGVYTSWLTESGWYTDVVARAGKYYTDNAPIHVSDVTGVEKRTLQQTSLNNPWIFNASAELGRRISFKNRFFLEPQLQLNYTYMRHRDIELSETIDKYFNRWEGTSDADLSLVGRLGLTLGYTFKGKDEQPVGSAYVRVNYSHEFLGQMGVNIRNVEAGDPEMVEPELSLELPHRYSWWSTDVGVTRQWGKAWSFHGGARWTFKGIADRAWELNFGARYAF